MSRRDAIATDLRSADPYVRARAVGEVGMLALGHPPILDAMLAMTGDRSPLPDDLQPPSDDPFAAFFGAEPKKRTFAEHASERIFGAGLPGHHVAVGALVSILCKSEDPAACATAGRLFCETRWEDPESAARDLIPHLHKRGVSLASVIAGADPVTLEILVASALDPYRSQAVNELMNAPDARQQTAAAIVQILPNLDDARLTEALAVLISWEACPVEELTKLEGQRPWVVRFTALVDPSAVDRAEAFSGPEPPSLVLRLDEVG